MKSILNITFGGMVLLLLVSYNSKDIRENQSQIQREMTAKEILGNPDYPAISYGGYRDSIME